MVLIMYAGLSRVPIFVDILNEIWFGFETYVKLLLISSPRQFLIVQWYNKVLYTLSSSIKYHILLGMYVYFPMKTLCSFYSAKLQHIEIRTYCDVHLKNLNSFLLKNEKGREHIIFDCKESFHQCCPYQHCYMLSYQ